MIADDKTYYLIVNPVAGRGRVDRAVQSIIRKLESMAIPYRTLTSERSGHAIELAAGLDGRTAVVVAVGGDGTVHEIVNGLTKKDQLVGVVPTGTGNDFARLLGMENPLDTMDAITTASPLRLDIGRIEIEEEGGGKIHRCFVNTLGLGFDAEVAVRANKMKFGSGILPYLVSVFMTLRSFRSVPALVSWNDGVIESKLFLASIGNGTTSGGGFILSPQAKPDDGLLDLCFVREVTRMRALRLLPKTFHGKHVAEKEVTYVQSETISIELESPLSLHADGEILSEKVRKIHVKLTPREGRFLVGPKKGW
ncbi:MAG: diacylglycerol kinase family lipid kinase [Chlorobi bacterium]|nr:diacylglycerol kinase family lipid kinase [Chlorobiota bacterium]